MLPQMKVGPNMARTMVEDRHGVKPLGALAQALWRDIAASQRTLRFRSGVDFDLLASNQPHCPETFTRFG
jgi:hypothetical protein